ncbi:hypothetical protein HHI36_021745 [Cryptolaemus montrouzieri]|uniref:Uncharacterized protein n=1 Tax=Cryptolaemus montrouzieri TaxID=559131 RepID=A0ABD2MXZ6_9CUCU
MYGSKLVIIVFILSIKNLVENVTIKSLMEVDNLSVCPENDKLESPIKNLKYVKINRTHSALSFDLPLIHPLGETTGFQIALERWANGGWVTLPFMTSQKICAKN